MERNKQLASMLRQIGSLLAEQGVAFKPAAYFKAAQTVDELEADIAEFDTKKGLKDLPGIGDAIAEKILEFVETGRIKHLDELRGAQGALPEELLAIEDLGPKRVRQLQVLGIDTIPKLLKAAEEGKLRDLPRFSELMERKILENAKNVEERTKRYPRKEVVDDVEEILKTLRDVPGVERAEAAGSYRREKATVGDIDTLVVTESPKEVSNAIAALPMVQSVVAHGDKKLSYNLTSGIRVDTRFVNRDQWGSALLYFTGSKEHNIALRKRAIDRGWKLNEYGLFEGDKVIASKEEKDIYEALDLPFIEPTKRTEILPV